MHPLSIRRLSVVVAGVFAAVLAVLATALQAGATVNPVHLKSQTASGAYAAPTADHLADGDHVTGVKEQHYLIQSQRFDASLGVELCTALSLTTSSQVVVLYTHWNPGTGKFDVIWGTNSGVSCLDAKSTASVNVVDSIDPGHQVFLGLTQAPNGHVFYTEEDLTADTGAFHVDLGWFSRFNRAGIGSEATIADLNSPPALKLVRFTNDQVRETSFGPFTSHWINIGNPVSTRIRTRLVDQANVSGDVFVAPVISGTQLKLYRGTLNS